MRDRSVAARVASDDRAKRSTEDARHSEGFGHLYLTRARSTWLQAHLLAGTPLAALRVIAGPLSLNTLTQLLSVATQNVDPEDAARQGLKP